MTIEYLIDFTSHVHQQLCPRLNEVQTWLNCTVVDLPRGNIILQNQPGRFTLKVFDNEKGKKLENRIIKYFLPGDKEGKNPICIKISKKPLQKRFINPKWVNIWGTFESDLGGFITNEQMTKLFAEYGSMIVPVHDVHDLSENVWALDKKNFRIDFDKGTHIPRNFTVEHKTAEGKVIKASLRITYKDQPRFCRQCVSDHTGDCPKWIEKQKRLQEIKEQKEKLTKTIIIGDSNLKQVNSNALLADVVVSSGAKIGHISNQMNFERLDAYKNIVILAGINNIPNQNEIYDTEKMGEQIQTEMDGLEKKLSAQMEKGTNVYVTQVAKAAHTMSKRSDGLREKINDKYTSMINNLRKKPKGKKAKCELITWPETMDEHQFSSIKAINEQSTVNYLHLVCQKVGDQTIRANFLDSKLTCYQYANVTTTYPVGCYKCTKMSHSVDECTASFSKKRQASQELDNPSKDSDRYVDPQTN